MISKGVHHTVLELNFQKKFADLLWGCNVKNRNQHTAAAPRIGSAGDSRPMGTTKRLAGYDLQLSAMKIDKL